MWPFVYMGRLSSGSIYDGWDVGLEVALNMCRRYEGGVCFGRSEHVSQI